MAKPRTLGDFRKKVTEIHEMISTSYHESAHTIYGLINGLKIDNVSIFHNKENNRIEGYTNYTSPNLFEIKDEVLFEKMLNTEICMRYAGLISERLLFKIMSGSDNFPAFLKDGSSNDTFSAAAFIRQYNVAAPGKPRYSLKKKLIKQTSKDLEENWSDITLISHHLYKKKKLTYFDLKYILCKHSDRKKYWKELLKNIEVVYNTITHVDEDTLKSTLFL